MTPGICIRKMSKAEQSPTAEWRFMGKSDERSKQFWEDKEKLGVFLQENFEKIRSLPEDACGFLADVTGTEELFKNRENREMRDMCKAIADMKRESIEQGEHRKLLSIVKKKLMKKQSPEKIADALEEDVTVILKLMDEIEL